MWCGCGENFQIGNAEPQPFSTMDEEQAADAPSLPPYEGTTRTEWCRVMQLVPSPHQKVQVAALEAETVLYDLRNGRVYRLDAVGTAIWEQCTGSARVHEIARALTARLRWPIEQMRDRVVSLISQWIHDGLLVQSEQAKVSSAR